MRRRKHGRVVGLGLDVGVGNTGRVDEDIWGAVELDDGINGGVDGGAVTDVDLEEGDGEARELVQLGGGGVTELLVGIKDDNVLGAGLSAGAGHVVAEATGAAGDDDGLAKDGHVLDGARQGLVDLFREGLDGLVLGRGLGAVKGDLGGTVGDLDSALVAGAGPVVDGGGHLLLADDVVLLGGVGDALDGGGGKGPAGGGLEARDGRGGAGQPQDVASSERHGVSCVWWSKV